MAVLQQRNISLLTRNTFALILAGGKGSRLHELTDWRAKPAVYFGGKFRIIDFPLSNRVNSGIRNCGAHAVQSTFADYPYGKCLDRVSKRPGGICRSVASLAAYI